MCGVRVVKYKLIITHYQDLGKDERKEMKVWMSAVRHNISSRVQMETNSRMLRRKVIDIDLFVPFLWTAICCKMESRSWSEDISAAFSFNGLFQAPVPDVGI